MGGDHAPDEIVRELAEESGLIVPIGRWVLAEACRTSRQWRMAGFRDVRCAVNLSARQLVEDDLFAYISRVLRECFMPPSSLEATEMLEQLRVLQAGYKIRVVDVALDSVGVDTPEDLKNVEDRLCARDAR